MEQKNSVAALKRCVKYFNQCDRQLPTAKTTCKTMLSALPYIRSVFEGSSGSYPVKWRAGH